MHTNNHQKSLYIQDILPVWSYEAIIKDVSHQVASTLIPHHWAQEIYFTPDIYQYVKTLFHHLNDHSVVQICVKLWNIQTVSLCLELGYKPTIKDLYQAYAYNHAKLVQLFLDSGGRDIKDHILMALALHSDDIDMIRVLISYVKEIDGPIWKPLTYIASAVSEWKQKLVEVLLENGVDVNKYRSGIFSPLQIAREKWYKDIENMLHAHGAL